jgi:hypothetical protein
VLLLAWHSCEQYHACWQALHRFSLSTLPHFSHSSGGSLRPLSMVAEGAETPSRNVKHHHWFRVAEKRAGVLSVVSCRKHSSRRSQQASTQEQHLVTVVRPCHHPQHRATGAFNNSVTDRRQCSAAAVDLLQHTCMHVHVMVHRPS